MKNILVQTENLTKTFKGRTVVNNVNLNLQQGDIYGFLGPNGAGKTTTIKMLLGLVQPTSGSIMMFNRNLKKSKIPVLSQIGSLVESPSYYGHLTARENLEVIRRIINASPSKIDEVLSIVKLTEHANRPVKGFSLGMKQRLGIATSLMGSPKLLILDEPTNGLDPSGIHEIRELIKRMPKDYGITVLISSHLLSEIHQMATHVGIITNGSLIFQDSIEALNERANPKITLTVDKPTEALNSLLGNGYSAEIRSKKIVLNDLIDSDIARIIRMLSQTHDIYRVEEEKKSLEDIFLEITNGEKSL